MKIVMQESKNYQNEFPSLQNDLINRILIGRSELNLAAKGKGVSVILVAV